MSTQNFIFAQTSHQHEIITDNTDIKDDVDYVAIANVALAGEQNIDGSVTNLNRVILTAQTISSQNGWYDTAPGAWARCTDADMSAEVEGGVLTYSRLGTLRSNTMWALRTDDPIVLGTTPLSFVQVEIPVGFFVGKNESSAVFNLVRGDVIRRIVTTNAAAKVGTVPTQASVNWPAHAEIHFANKGAGLLTLVGAGGVTINSVDGILTIPQYAVGILKKDPSVNNVWTLSGVVQKNIVRANAAANLTAGYTGTALVLGNIAAGTFTPDPTLRQMQEGTNVTAFNLAPPSVGAGNSAHIMLKITNGATPGVITPTGWNKTVGAFNVVVGDKFMCTLSVINGDKLLTIQGLQ